MPGRVRGVTGLESLPLHEGWELCTTPPGTFAEATAMARGAPSWIPATVPSTVASALRAAGRFSLDGPARRFDAEDAWYRTTLRLASAAGPRAETEEVWLCCDGLATIAEVYLDGRLLLESRDMFLAREVRIDGLAGATCELALCFRALDPLLAERRPRPRWRVPMVEQQQLRWFRTTLLGRTPGWSPPAAPVGPFRPIRIERRRGVRVGTLRLTAGLDGPEGTDGWAHVEAEINGPRGEPVDSVALVVEHDGSWHREVLSPSGRGWAGRLGLRSVRRWWPHTHGEPALHPVRLQVEHRGGAAEVDLGAIGFRSIALDRRDEGFALAVNGAPVFCRGAAWTPLDAVALRSPAEAVPAALEQVRAAGMNMLRLSGALLDEEEAFYDGCDRSGLMLWHDLPFANFDYPGEDPAFSALAVEETRHLLGRLQGRPCLAVLCGNSEVEQQAAMWGAPRALWSPPLFHETLAAVARESCPGVPYWPSSAHGGAFPHQPSAGTTSYYGVGAYLRPLEDARRAAVRFASECLGFANVPGPPGMMEMPGGGSLRVHDPRWKERTPRDLGAGWDFDDVRDHYLALLFGVDPVALRYADHERYLALGRVTTGEVMAATLSEWRRRGSGCGGALVWLLRDLWAGAGWGLIEAGGAPKPAWFILRRALQPIRLALSDEGTSGLFLHALNERREPLAANLEVALFRDGAVPVAGGRREIALAPDQPLELPLVDLLDDFVDTTWAYRFGPPGHDLTVATLRSAAGALLAEAFHLPGGFARPREHDLGLSAEAASRTDGGLDLTVRTRRFAQSVALEVPGFEPEDNYFHLAPASERRLRLARGPGRPSSRGTMEALNAAAAVRFAVPS